jgi:hypothetical protein
MNDNNPLILFEDELCERLNCRGLIFNRQVGHSETNGNPFKDHIRQRMCK